MSHARRRDFLPGHRARLVLADCRNDVGAASQLGGVVRDIEGGPAELAATREYVPQDFPETEYGRHVMTK